MRGILTCRHNALGASPFRIARARASPRDLQKKPILGRANIGYREQARGRPSTAKDPERYYIACFGVLRTLHVISLGAGALLFLRHLEPDNRSIQINLGRNSLVTSALPPHDQNTDARCARTASPKAGGRTEQRCLCDGAARLLQSTSP